MAQTPCPLNPPALRISDLPSSSWRITVATDALTPSALEAVYTVIAFRGVRLFIMSASLIFGGRNASCRFC